MSLGVGYITAYYSVMGVGNIGTYYYVIGFGVLAIYPQTILSLGVDYVASYYFQLLQESVSGWVLGITTDTSTFLLQETVGWCFLNNITSHIACSPLM